MPTYILKTTASDISPFTDENKEMSAGVGTDTFYATGNIGAGASEQHGFITPAGVPNSDSWESGGNWTVEIEIDTADADMDISCRAVRVNSSGTILQSGSFTATQTGAATRTFTVVAPTWTVGQEDCDNRLAIEVLLECTAPHGNCSLEIGVGTAANEIITDVTEDDADCVAAGQPMKKRMALLPTTAPDRPRAWNIKRIKERKPCGCGNKRVTMPIPV